MANDGRLKKLLEIKEDIENAKKESSVLEGRKEELLKTLSEEFEVKDLGDAEKLLEKLEKEIEEGEKEIEEGFNKLLKKYEGG